MTDRELLEYSAKAAGINIKWTLTRLWDGSVDEVPDIIPRLTTFEQPVWNPLTDDGDALRLAVKLKMPIEYTSDKPFGPDRTAIKNGYGVVEDHISDPYAATRRAIVRAAAEIGKTMQ